MSNLLGQLLQRAAFDTLTFPVTECTQQGARQVTENEQWRRDGAELVNGGRKAFRGKITAAFFDTIEGYGDLFPVRFEALLTRFYSDGEGTLSHPLLGNMQVMVPSWEPRISTKALNGAFVDFEWIEQRASSVGVIALELERGAGDPRAELEARAAAADAALTAAGAAPATPLSTVTSSALAKVSGAALPYTEVSRAVGSVERAADASREDLAAVAVTPPTAVALWTARAAVAKVLVAAGRLRAALLPDPSRATAYQLARPMTFAEVSVAVYGTPFRAADLRAANAVARDLVPAGRVLTVLP